MVSSTRGIVLVACIIFIALLDWWNSWLSSVLPGGTRETKLISTDTTKDAARTEEHTTSFQPISSWPTYIESLRVDNFSWYDGKDFLSVFPKPKRPETVEIYNKQAWRMLYETITEKNVFSLCANGGSSTAGGGLSQGPSGKYHYQFVNFLNWTSTVRPNAKVEVIDRGHGTRNSFHSAVFADFFFKPKTDILLWEFAINDASPRVSRDKGLAPNEVRRYERNMLIAWLQQVSRIKPRPPLVILAYLWESPFGFDQDGRIKNPNFDFHQKLAADYDFVVGHVNLASYLEELHLNETVTKDIFIADVHHPNAVGHAALAYLLLDLVVDRRRAENTVSFHQQQNKTFYEWDCGTDNEDKVFLKQRFLDDDLMSSGTTMVKPCKASYTFEKPRNEQVYPGMLVHRARGDSMGITLGKTSKNRIDRQKAVVLPCCSESGDAASLNEEFVVPFNKSLANIQAFKLGLKRWEGELSVFLDGKRAHGHSIPTHEWPCPLASQPNMYREARWYALEKEWNASSVQLCSNDTCCKTAGATKSCSNLLSFAVY